MLQLMMIIDKATVTTNARKTNIQNKNALISI